MFSVQSVQLPDGVAAGVRYAIECQIFPDFRAKLPFRWCYCD
jgi:hypothetical protein